MSHARRNPVPRRARAAAALALAVAAGEAGADAVGFRDIAFAADGETLVAALWYPSGAAPGRTALGPISMAAARDAPLAAGRHGLVLISHGTGGGRLNHRGTAIRLARAGYVAVAPEHAGDSWRDARHSGTAANWRRRPRQLAAALDRVLGDAGFGPRIDRRRIGALGHSAGGFSVLALAGARADLSVLARHCTRHRDRDPEFCAYGPRDAPAGGALPDFSDRRIGAVLAVAPVGALFGAGAFAGVTVPVEIHRLGGDRVLRRPWHEDNIARLMGNRARLAVHPDAHHFAFVAPFPAALVAQVGRPARDPPGFDRRAFLARIDRRIVDFFDRALPAPDAARGRPG